MSGNPMQSRSRWVSRKPPTDFAEQASFFSVWESRLALSLRSRYEAARSWAIISLAISGHAFNDSIGRSKCDACRFKSNA